MRKLLAAFFALASIPASAQEASTWGLPLPAPVLTGGTLEMSGHFLPALLQVPVDGSGRVPVNIRALGGTTLSGADVVDVANTSFRVNCVVGCSGSSFADNAAFTFGTTAVSISAGVLDDVATNAATENSAAAYRISSNRNIYFQLRDGTGAERGAAVSAANALKVDGSAVTQPVSGSVTASDPTFTDATGTTVPANAAFVAGTDGTNTRALKTDAGGELQVDVLTMPTVTVTDGAGAMNVIVDSGSLTANAGSGTFTTQDTSSLVDDAAFTPATSRVLPVGATFDAVTPDLVNEGDIGALRMSDNRNAYIQLRDGASGSERGAAVDASNRLSVAIDNIGTINLNGTSAVNLSQVGGATVAVGNGVSGTGVQRVTLASDSTGQVALATGSNTIGALTANQSVNAAQIGGTNTVSGGTAGTLGVGGAVAHDTAGTSNPVVAGAEAIAHGADPTVATAGRPTKTYANRDGIPFMIGGHMNAVAREVTVADADGAQTGIAVDTVAAGNKIVVTSVMACADEANTAAVNVRVAFSTSTTLPTASTTGVSGVLLSHPGLIPGACTPSRGDGSGILGIGADDEDLRYTVEDPVGGSIRIIATYFKIES